LSRRNEARGNAAVFHGMRKIGIADVSKPEPDPNGVLIKKRADVEPPMCAHVLAKPRTEAVKIIAKIN